MKTMTLKEMLTTLAPDQLPDTIEFTADAALQQQAEAVGYTLVFLVYARREYDPVTGVSVQMGVDRMVMQHARVGRPWPAA